MTTRIFIGKLSYDTTETTLGGLFAEYGEVAAASVVMDRATNRSRGFAFVEMTDMKAAQAAIKALDNKEVDGRAIAVSAAKERDNKPRTNAGYRRSW